MNKKLLMKVSIGYLLYAVLIYFYLFVLDSAKFPEKFEGTAADPATFLTDRELVISSEYSLIRNYIFFLEFPLQALFYFIILASGFGKRLENWLQDNKSHFLLKSAIFTLFITIINFIFFFPIRVIRWFLAKNYGLSTQSFSSWMKDGGIDLVVNWILLFIIVITLVGLLRNIKKWWLHAWFLMIPAVFFYMFIQPVLIDPLYNDFYRLQDKQLEEKILALAAEAEIPAEHVYEVNMSSKTNTLNAYVTGVGSSSRIVLWDTTLSKLNEEEILFIMAHEMAHYKEKHIYIGLTGYILFALVAFYFTAKIANWMVLRYKSLLHIQSLRSFTGVILIMFIISTLLLIANPAINSASRYIEHRADRYAIELTENVDAGISMFQELTRHGLSQVHPPQLVKIFRYTHPTIFERIVFVEKYREKLD